MLKQIGGSFIQYLVGAVAGTIGLVIILGITIALLARLFNINVNPYRLYTSRLLSFGQVVDFREAFEAESSQDLRVCKVERRDTDNDGFKEWLVFYQFDTVGSDSLFEACPDQSPRTATIYDNDRGNPSIIFPYSLKVPDRDYLGEQGLNFEAVELVANPNAKTENPIDELFFYGYGAGVINQLTIFKFKQNTEPWESPTDEIPRYQVIGAFTGNGGVSFNSDTKEVTVLDRGPFDRSQLAIKNVYQLHGPEGQESYMTEIGATSLSSPTFSSIDFGVEPPIDIFNTEFPEKIVLGFYQSLDSSYNREWNSIDFLETDSEASNNFEQGNLSYFGFNNDSNNISKLAVVQLQYFPDVEQTEAIGSIEGPKLTVGRVEINFSANQNGTDFSANQIIKYKVVIKEGKWKISSKLP